MADLTDKTSSQTVKIVGADINGIENNFVTADATGALVTRLKSTNYDAFGRIRISDPTTIFEASFPVDKYVDMFSELTASGGAVTQDANLSSVILSTGATSGSTAKFQTRIPFKYHPGKSNLILITGSLIEAKANTKKYLGQFDENNGYYFLLEGSTLKVGIRTKVSGSVVDTEVAQSAWNTDKLDGTGQSGVTLDITKQQIFFIDYQWLGSGMARFGVSIGGELIICHEFKHANILATPYSSTANLPIRTEIVSSAANSASTLRLTCVSLTSEGGQRDFGSITSVSTGNTARTLTNIGTQTALVVIRLRANLTNVYIDPLEFSALGSTTDDFIIRIVKNPTVTGGTWNNAGRITSFNTTTTSVTGGTILYQSYFRAAANTQALVSDILNEAFESSIGYDMAGTRDTLALVAVAVTNNSNIYGSFTIREVI